MWSSEVSSSPQWPAKTGRPAVRDARVRRDPEVRPADGALDCFGAPAEGRLYMQLRTKELPVDVTIIGTGNMARGIATRTLTGGHSVTLLGTTADKAEALAADLGGDVRAGQAGDPLAGDVIVLAVWYQAVDDVLATYGDQLDGKIVVDITNPVDPQTYA